MRIKTFQGRTLEEVLPQIREQLGSNAVVLGQRSKVQGGVGGFFGTKVIEVTAADRMPDDEQLVDLEDRMMDGSLADGDAGQQPAPEEEATELAARFAGAMQMGRRGGIDMTDEWDPAQDEELASEYGRVLEHAAAAGFSELDVPTASVNGAAPQQALQPQQAPQPQQPQLPSHDPLAQARALADRAHDHVQSATERVEGTYAPPIALPRTTPASTQTFAASVVDVTPPVAFEPLRHESPSDPISAAIELIDLRAVAALRSANEASRRIDTARSSDPALTGALAHLAEVGADDDVVAAVSNIVLRHRLPFAAHDADLGVLVRDVVEELLETRSGYATTSTGHVMALVGPASGGKTTAVAKLAHTYRTAGLSVGIAVVLPNDPTAPILQDPRLVSLGADVRYITSIDQAIVAAEGFAQHDLVIVDTPGGSHRDHALFGHVSACLNVLKAEDIHVVVPLATSSREASGLVDAFRPLGANRLIVSRLDESQYAGQLLNFGFRLGLPMTFLSDGPRIPQDLRAASAREIADRILPSVARTRIQDQEISAP
ncbi:MAG: flhF [Thermoleophilia bacterium]|nr:flhF [Thermoleophilia bacterium]MCZ4496873.1 flhF [Thermoleophilia bacterium]